MSLADSADERRRSRSRRQKNTIQIRGRPATCVHRLVRCSLRAALLWDETTIGFDWVRSYHSPSNPTKLSTTNRDSHVYSVSSSCSVKVRKSSLPISVQSSGLNKLGSKADENTREITCAASLAERIREICATTDCTSESNSSAGAPPASREYGSHREIRSRTAEIARS